jgi:hypothetical protein
VAATLRRRALAAAVLLAAGAGPAAAWLTSGHRRVTVEAVRLLPAEVPHFFRAGAAAVGRTAGDPDLWRNRGTPALAERVAPEHFLDLELLRGEPLPARRSEYLALLARLGVEPRRAGALPYAIVEGAELLALAFAEHRRWPGDEVIRSKCLLHAGWLAHYAADLEQPLHTTIHHDGRARPDGSPPFTGIHRRVDALFDHLPRHFALRADEARPTPIADLGAAVRAELAASHALVDAVYALEPQLMGEGPSRDARLAAFAAERYRTTARFVAGVLLWSWERSAEIELPEWLVR